MTVQVNAQTKPAVAQRGSADDRSSQLMLKLLREGESVRFRALGGSMWPWVPAGSLVEVQPAAPASLRVGCLAAFTRSGRLVVHRVRSTSETHIGFGGDATGFGQLESIRLEDVLGEARVVERGRLAQRLPRWSDLKRLLRGLRSRYSRY